MGFEIGLFEIETFEDQISNGPVFKGLGYS